MSKPKCPSCGCRKAPVGNHEPSTHKVKPWQCGRCGFVGTIADFEPELFVEAARCAAREADPEPFEPYSPQSDIYGPL